MSGQPPAGLELPWLLACSALEQGLGGLLLIDLPPVALPAVAMEYARLLGSAGGAPPRRILLGSHQDDDALWSTWRLGAASGSLHLGAATGALVPAAPGEALLAVVPDLARLGLAATRSVLATLGTPVVLLERHGVSAAWPPRVHWIAACAASDIGRVSQHVLDRFALRFPAGRVVPVVDPVRRVLDAVDSVAPGPANSAARAAASPANRAARPAASLADSAAGQAADQAAQNAPDQRDVAGFRPPRLPRTLTAALAPGTAAPEVTDAAIERATQLHPAAAGLRRPLALLRLARAFARLHGDAEVRREHTEDAAVFIGLIQPTVAVGPAVPDPGRPSPPREPTEPPEPPEPTDPAWTADRPTPAATDAVPGLDARAVPVYAGGTAEVMADAAADTLLAGPYPEDGAAPEREASPLRLPWRPRNGRPTDRGTVLGTTRATELDDIAWLDTIREAAKFQAVRRRRGAVPAQGGMLISGADLRAYRRAPEADHLIVLVLDHTCRRGWDWVPALAPYLHRAYARRAAVCLVEVGDAAAPSALRAERTLLRSLLDPRTAAALDRRPGAATPLAHGLELARLVLRHALQHGQAQVAEADLVVVTDGLGNVPLADSLQDTVAAPVTGEGVDDALAAARALAELPAVQTVVIQPPRSPYPRLVTELAQALGPRCRLVSAGGPGNAGVPRW